MMTGRVVGRLGVLSMLLLSTLAMETARAAEAGSGWRAGAARVEITPTGPVWMAGYAARKSPSEGIEHPIFAKALALSDGKKTILWITADLIGFDREFTERVAGRLRESHGLPREAVALFASHTHTGPTLKITDDPDKNNPDFRRDLEEKIVAMAGQALTSMVPADTAYGVGRADFAMNRREKTATGIKNGVNPDGPTDKSVPVLRVSDAQGKPLAVVFGYACHNTTMTAQNMRLSGDYAGFAQSRIEAEHPGAVALFVTGCGGDANPYPRGTPELARKYGDALAEAVEGVLARPMPPLHGGIRAAFAAPTIRFAGPTDRASYEARLNESPEGRRAHARRLIADLDAGKPIRAEHSYPMHAFALGDRLVMLTLAGEVVVDYALRLPGDVRVARDSLWVAAYADDVFGYVGSARVIREGGYEGLESYYHASHFAAPLSEDVEATIVASARDLVAKVRGR